MQFGKFHGLVLVGFGFLLLLVQGWMVLQFAKPSMENPASESEKQAKETSQERVPQLSYIPAIAGGIAILIGGTLLLIHQEQKIQAYEHREDARTHGHV